LYKISHKRSIEPKPEHEPQPQREPKVALINFDELLTDVVKSGRTPDPKMSMIVEKMYNYLAYTLDPAGFSPLNSDSDTVYNADFIMAAAATFNRLDWA
jgi:hypothetical protein